MAVVLDVRIPTYKRFMEFQRLLGQLARDIGQLDRERQARVRVSVLENPSTETSAKREVFNRAELGRAESLWFENPENIGGDPNIENAYNNPSDSDFTWVVGDDEQIREGAVGKILSHLQSHPSCGLLLLQDGTYPVDQRLLDRASWPNYGAFAREVAIIQPHLLLAHTLITANVVRSEIFDVEASRRQRYRVAPRAGLSFSFAHAVGFLTGLSARDDLPVELLLPAAIDTSNRSQPQDQPEVKRAQQRAKEMEQWATIRRLYRHHLYWIGHEFGVDVLAVQRHPSMTDIFGATIGFHLSYGVRTFVRRAVGRVKRLLPR